MKSLDKAAKYCGQTRQAFVTAAVLAEVSEVLEGRRFKKQRPRDYSSSIDELPRREIDTAVKSEGLGIAETMRRRREADEPAASALTPTTTPVVVNVGGNSSGGGNTPSSDVIERLAAYVAIGNDFERDSRLQNAISILHATTTTDEERKVLAARLDEAVAVKMKTSSANGSVVRAARVAFDKIAGILGGGE